MESHRVPWVPWTPDVLRSALFVSAILARRRDLSHTARSLVISSVHGFDIHDPKHAAEGLSEALISSGVKSDWYPRRNSLHEAAIKAEDWFRQGISCVRTESCLGSHARLHEIPSLLFVKGDPSILDIPAAAILNSRKPRRVKPEDSWLTVTKRAVRHALVHSMAIVSSYGNLPYDVVSYLAKGSPLIVVCDETLPFMADVEQEQRFLREYRDLFEMERTLLLSHYPPGRLPPRTVRYVERDRVVAALASRVMVAEVRRGGTMEAIARDAVERNVPIWRPGDESDGMPSPHRATEPRELARRESREAGSAIDEHRDSHDSDQSQKNTPGNDPNTVKRMSCDVSEALNGQRMRDDSLDRAEYLIHYTRSCPGPWPGQSIAQFCRSLIEGDHDAAHTALDTLNRILTERIIRGSNRMTRGARPVVSFTGHLPDRLNDLVKWRTGLARWTFERYGIAVRKETLVRLGAGQVIYGDEAFYEQMPIDERYLFQLTHRSGKDWSEEEEWRLPGSLDLADVDPRDIVVMVPTPEEAAVIERMFHLTVMILSDAP